MEAYKFKKDELKIYNILYATTSEEDYEMTRWLLLEDMPDTNRNEYVIVEGYHCSCYGFDDTNWEATKYTIDELKQLAETKIKGFHQSEDEEKYLWDYILIHFNRRRINE